MSGQLSNPYRMPAARIGEYLDPFPVFDLDRVIAQARSYIPVLAADVHAEGDAIIPGPARRLRAYVTREEVAFHLATPRAVRMARFVPEMANTELFDSYWATFSSFAGDVDVFVVATQLERKRREAFDIPRSTR